jgi:hypothetical protein
MLIFAILLTFDGHELSNFDTFFTEQHYDVLYDVCLMPESLNINIFKKAFR